MQSPTGDEAYNDNGLVPRTIRLLKDKFPDIVSPYIIVMCICISSPFDNIILSRSSTLMLPWILIHLMVMMALSEKMVMKTQVLMTYDL